MIAALGMIDPVVTMERPLRQQLTIAVQRDLRAAVNGATRDVEPRSAERHGSPESQQAMASAVTLQQLLSADYEARILAVEDNERAASCAPEAPCVLVGGERWTAPITAGLSSIVGAVRVPPREGPSVSIASATVPATVHRSAVGRLDVGLVARGVSGQRSTIDVFDGDVPVGSATHDWTSDGNVTVRVDWWPMDAGVRRLSIRATRGGNESSDSGRQTPRTEDGRADRVGIAAGPSETRGAASDDFGGRRVEDASDRVEDDRVDIGTLVEAEPYRVLVYDTRPSWTSTFVRRAIERDPRVAVRLVARLGPQLQVTAGEPFRLDPAALADASVVVIGALDDLSARDVDVLETFVRVRGGSLILAPDRKPTGPAARLVAMTSTERLEPAPIQAGDWRASELLVFQNLPDGASTLARVGVSAPPDTDAGGSAGAETRGVAARSGDTGNVLAGDGRRSSEAVVVAIPSGNGRVIVSGAMDAWRYRDTDSAAFDRAWQSLVADAAAAGGRPLDVTLDRSAVRPGDDVRVEVRLRSMTPIDGDTAVGATVTCEGDQDRVRALRLWPTGDRRVFEGHFAPTVSGSCRIGVTSSLPIASTATADVLVEGSDTFEKTAIGGETSAPVRETADRVTLERLMRGSDGRIIAPGDETTLARDIRRIVPAQTTAMPVRPMRSPWWIVPFAACLGAEWWLRRRRGLL